MSINYQKLTILAFSFFVLTSCGDDDTTDPSSEMGGTENPIETPTDLTTEEQQQETFEDVSDGDSKTWRITEAVLRNSNGEFNISDNFNVQDDEFIFKQSSGTYSLTWNRSHDIPAGASSADDALLDYYRSPLTYALAFDTESATNFGNSDDEVVFQKETSNFTGSIRLSSDSQLDVVLSEKTAADYESVPSNGLTFSEVASFDAVIGFAQQSNVGIAGSYSDNSLFIAHRADCGGPADGNGGTLRSRILKLDVNTNAITEEYSEFNDFFTRKLNIINNDLVLTGGTNIYTYENLDISVEPNAVLHEAGILSRYSTVTSGNDIYVIGGDLDQEIEANKIRKINSTTGALDVEALMPGSKLHAGSEIVNDKLYIFSGRAKFFDNSTVSTESFIYDLATGSFQNFNFPVALYNSYASRNGNLIYVAGDIQEDTDGDGTVDNYDIWLGVYDTLTGQITEVAHNLDDTDQFSYVQQLTVFNGKLYVIYGDAFASDGDPDCAMGTWSIMEAAL